MRPCVFVIGTRAQLVKVAPVLRAAIRQQLPHVVWFTGQHRESIDDLIEDFGLESDFVMPAYHRERSSVRSLLGWMPQMFFSCRTFILEQGRTAGIPPLVVVHGDTLSTFLGALAARLAKARVVHLESGLSSGSLVDPFPEELLRKLTFRLTHFALCPNEPAADRMRRFKRCIVVNIRENTLLDSVRFALNGAHQRIPGAPCGHYVASIHRFENIFSRARLERIVDDLTGLSRVAPVYFVLHPATERRLIDMDLMKRLKAISTIRLVPRMPYSGFLALLAEARGVVTDGGSNQEELSYLGVPTVLYRDRTERPDGLGLNAIFVKDLPVGLDTFAADGRMDALRVESALHSHVRPSDCSVAALSRWAAV